MREKQNMRSEENNVSKAAAELLRNGSENVLREQIAPFWLKLRDDIYGGYIGKVDINLSYHRHADKGTILHSRILWFFSELAMLTKDRRYADAADHAFHFLTEKCFDKRYGGVFWSVTYDGKPSDTVKHTYAQAFALYALSSYYALTENADAMHKAQSLFTLIETKCRDNKGYLECFDEQWKPLINDKLSENNVIAYRTMNTLLHIFEAYANLYRYKPDEITEKAMRYILDIYSDRIFSAEKQRLNVFFDEEYNNLIDLQSYGHDIEASWLIDDGCKLLGDDMLISKISDINSILCESVYSRAYCGSSLLNECENGKNDTDRIWWVQAEAVVGFLNQWKKTNNSKYLTSAAEIWKYIQKNIVDKRPGGEWFWGIRSDGEPMTGCDIVSEWKCPYHSGRMCFEILRRIKNDT